MNPVDSLALALEENPDDWQTRLVYADALEEEGQEEESSRQRRVARILRYPEAPSLLSLYRDLRNLAGCPDKRCPVEILPDDSPPTCHGQQGYSIFENGGSCQYPAAARRAGYRVITMPSTLRVTVGAFWLVDNGYVR